MSKKLSYPAKNHKLSIQKVVAAARRTGITETEIRRLLAGGKLGQAIPDDQLGHITKGIKIDRWSMLKRAIEQCDRKLRVKNLPEDIWVAVHKAKASYLQELASLTGELDTVKSQAASNRHGQAAVHAFAPREPIGNMTAVQVTIGRAQENAPVIDANILPAQQLDSQLESKNGH